MIRNIEENELEKLREWRNSTKINRYLFNRREISSSEHEAWFREVEKNPLRDILVYEENDKLVGFMQLKKTDEKTDVFEWGFYIDPEQLGEGLGSRFAVDALNYIFAKFKAEKIFGQVVSSNIPSIKLHEYLGFKLEGTLRKHCYLNETYQDVFLFGLLKQEWLLKRENI